MSRRTRGVALAAASAVLALLGAASLARYAHDVDGRVGNLVPVVRLRHEVAALRPLTASDVEVVRLPRRWAPPRALARPEQAAGLVAATRLGPGTHLTTDLLVPRPELAPGQREVAILIDAATGVAGKVAAGSRVDIVATFDGAEGREARSEVVVAGAAVLEVGDLRLDEADDDGLGAGRSVPVTFALSVREALVLTYAESFAARVRLAAVSPLDDRPVPVDERTFTLPGAAGAPGTAGADVGAAG